MFRTQHVQDHVVPHFSTDPVQYQKDLDVDFGTTTRSTLIPLVLKILKIG